MRNFAFPLLALVLAISVSSDLRAQPPGEKVRDSLQNYFKAWTETDAGQRSKLLETAWAEKGSYTDPTAHVVGREALVAHIGAFLANPQFKSMSIVQASDIDIHHRVFRFQWKMIDAAENELMTGMDYGEFDDRGHITKIVGFFGPFPELK